MRHYNLSRLDRLLVFCAGLAVLSATVASVFAYRATHPPADYQVGEFFAKVTGLEPRRSAGTLVWFINTQCAHCQKTTDVARQIAQRPRHYQVAVVGYEDVASLQRYVDTFGIAADVVLRSPVNSIRFSGVPKMAMLNRKGVITAIWSGSGQICASLRDIRTSAEAAERGEVVEESRR